LTGRLLAEDLSLHRTAEISGFRGFAVPMRIVARAFTT